jgi:exosortase
MSDYDMGSQAGNIKTDLSGSESETGWLDLGLHSWIKIIIIGGLLFHLFNDEVTSIVRRWVEDPSWSHGFLIPVFSLYFINQHRNEILKTKVKPNYIGLALIIFGIAFYALNKKSASRYGYLDPMCMIGVLGAVVLFLCGWRILKYTWLAIFFLVFAVPLPTRYYFLITMPMRKWAAAAATLLLNMVNGLQATAHGVVIDVVYKGNPVEPALNVAEACSGMRLLMAFMALGVAMAYLHYRPIWQRLVLLGSTIPIAIFCNIIRVTVTGFIYILIHPKYAQGIYHDMLGMAMLPLAFGLYGFLAWFMSSLFIEEADIVREDIVVSKRKA